MTLPFLLVHGARVWKIETDAAARWADIYKRYDAAFRDRKKLIALALWDL